MKTFKRGGVHPPEYKELTQDKAIELLPIPDKVYIPISQHIGAPAKLIVKKGDKVDKGQLIAEASGFVSANVHASVSGTVTTIEKIANAMGRTFDHVVIENDKEERWAEDKNVKRDWSGFNPAELRDVIFDNGIVGMGGATFPTHVKLTPPNGKEIDTLIINGIECEPYLTCDHRLMLEKTKKLATGIRIIQKILGVKNVVVGIESNKVDAFKKLKAEFNSDNEIEVLLLEVKYPQGAEKQLIESILGREVPAGGLPLDVGVVVQNISTCLAVYEAVEFNKPLIERVVTVSGDGVENPGNYLVRIGTPIRNLLEASKLKKKVSKIINGGPMMGIAIFNVEQPVIKGTSGIIALKKVPNFMPGPCIRCGRCVQVCPLGGIAAEIARAVEAGNQEEYEGLHVLDCMECGSCSFVCPARRPLVQYIKQAKEEMAMKKRKEEAKKKEE